MFMAESFQASSHSKKHEQTSTRYFQLFCSITAYTKPTDFRNANAINVALSLYASPSTSVLSLALSM